MPARPALWMTLIAAGLGAAAASTWDPFRPWREANARACAANQKTLEVALEMYTLDY